MPISPDRLPPRELQPAIIKANLRTIVSAFPFVDPTLAINPEESRQATRSVRAPWIGAEFLTSVSYNTETGEIGKPPVVYEAGEWSKIETRLRVEVAITGTPLRTCAIR